MDSDRLVPVPQTAAEWFNEAPGQHNMVLSTSIHDLREVMSGSNIIEKEQYLTLRNLWKTRRVRDADFEKEWGIIYRSAREELAKNSFWEAYLSEVENNGLNGEACLGTFDMIFQVAWTICSGQRKIPQNSSRHIGRKLGLRVPHHEQIHLILLHPPLSSRTLTLAIWWSNIHVKGSFVIIPGTEIFSTYRVLVKSILSCAMYLLLK